MCRIYVSMKSQLKIYFMHGVPCALPCHHHCGASLILPPLLASRLYYKLDVVIAAVMFACYRILLQVPLSPELIFSMRLY